MKISFSIYNICNNEEAQEALKNCDLIILPAGDWGSSLDKLREIGGIEPIHLRYCSNSTEVYNYLSGKCPPPSRGALAAELEAIKQSLPKGEELTIYTMDSFHNGTAREYKLTLQE